MQAFVSYAHTDLDPLRAARVMEALSRANIDVWHGKDLDPGKEWVAAIDSAVRGADLFVILLTPAYLTSPWCEIELGTLLSEQRDRGTPLLTIIMKTVDDAQVPAYLRRFQVIDGRGTDPAKLTDMVAEAVKMVKLAA